MEGNGTGVIKKIMLWFSLFGSPLFLMVFVLFVVVLFSLGLFEGTSSSSGGISSSSGDKECGFTISTTSLSKSEYKEKLKEYAEIESRAAEFYEHADNIYDYAKASGINPELVIVRADVEGYSPGGSTNNYWGLGCGNEQGVEACLTYSSFKKGYEAFVDNISQYSSLTDMMTSYAFIGYKWVKGNWIDGGCVYFDYIKEYYASTTEAQESKKNAEEACAAGGTGISTTQYDQDAYMMWQVNQKMPNSREKIFGLTDKNYLCSSVESSGIANGNFINPCPGASYVSSNFGKRTSPTAGASTNHNGIDLAAATGTDVYAADGGTVVHAYDYNTGPRGKYIDIDHGNGIYTRYQHLNEVLVQVGQKVDQGQLIGKVGNTGVGTGPHLHFEVLVGGLSSDANAVDPRNYVTFSFG